MAGIVAEMADRRCDDLGVGGARKVEELVDLVGRDIGQDSAVRVGVEKPVWSDGAVQPMRSEAGRLDHTADSARLR